MSYTLSAEEYILSLLLMDGVEAAASIKDEVFEGISDRELETRLDSATNGLLSKPSTPFNLRNIGSRFSLGKLLTERITRRITRTYC